MMNFFKSFLRERLKYIGVLAASLLVFAAVLLLIGIPAEALGYPALLCLFLGLLGLIVDFLRTKGRYKERGGLEQLTLSMTENLPEAYSEEGQAYRQAVLALSREYRDFIEKSDAKYENMMEYYTVWAHQIKTPIASMKLSLQGQDSEFARKLSADLLRIEQYVDMVLVYLRLDFESTDYVFRRCSTDALIKRSVRKFASDFIERKLWLKYEAEDTVIVTDEKWLGFVIGQLLSNALKYTKEGGITIYFREPKVLVIEDTGIGIAAEDLPRIFEKGYTGYNGRTGGNASGIGLYLCKRICENLRIGIRAESEVGRGTKMILDLNQYKLKDE